MLLSQTPALSPIKSADNKTEKRQQAKLKDDERLEDLGLAIARSFSFCGLSVTPELYKLVDCEGEHRPGNQDKFNQPAQRNTPSGDHILKRGKRPDGGRLAGSRSPKASTPPMV